MARELYIGDLAQHSDATSAPGAPFTVWTDPFAGDEVTNQMVGADGVTPLANDGAGHLLTDGSGYLPYMRGPDEYQLPLFADTGTGQRKALIPLTVFSWLIQQVGLLLDGGIGGGGLPAGTTLEDIPNGPTRIAFTDVLAQKLSTIAEGATKTPIGAPDPVSGKAIAGTAKPGDWLPTPKQIGAPVNVAGAPRFWGRTVAQGLPTAAEDRQLGDIAFVDAT